MSVFSISVGNKKSIELEKCMFRVSHERVNISSEAFKLISYIYITELVITALLSELAPQI